LEAVAEFMVPAAVLGRVGGPSLKISKKNESDSSASQVLIDVPVSEIEELWRGRFRA
jgi:hypothetical protein